MRRIVRVVAPLLGAAAALWPTLAWAQDYSGDRAAGLFGGAFLCCWGIFGIVWLALLVLWLWMLIDAIKRPEQQFGEGMTKTVWIVLLILLSGLAAIAYYFMVYKKMGKATA